MLEACLGENKSKTEMTAGRVLLQLKLQKRHLGVLNQDFRYTEKKKK